MERKKVWAVYFSATGTTERIVLTIAKKLGEELGLPVEKFDFTLKSVRALPKSFAPTDIVVFGTPVIAGRVPNVLLKYLDALKGKEALAVPVVLYGNRNYDDALIELRDILTKQGFKPVAAGAFIGEHSFSEKLGKERPDGKDLAVAAEFAAEIAKKTKGADFDENSLIAVKGESPLRPYYQPRDSKGNPIDIRKVTPKTNGKCVNCKLCAVICPLGSIRFEYVGEMQGICMKCCACIKKCPVGAKYFDDPNFLYHKEELELQYSRRAEPEIFV
ncbi:MAG: EFR1 family ferrodoxin [Fusobacteriaceae bacterium]|jgi:ferredoxin/menaquinone-dependent protoporphyrinogen IX oxidase|nr:EFR1 family ferrodoxin [Fusobacteriaceae bacterium]